MILLQLLSASSDDTTYSSEIEAATPLIEDARKKTEYALKILQNPSPVPLSMPQNLITPSFRLESAFWRVNGDCRIRTTQGSIFIRSSPLSAMVKRQVRDHVGERAVAGHLGSMAVTGILGFLWPPAAIAGAVCGVANAVNTATSSSTKCIDGWELQQWDLAGIQANNIVLHSAENIVLIGGRLAARTMKAYSTKEIRYKAATVNVGLTGNYAKLILPSSQLSELTQMEADQLTTSGAVLDLGHAQMRLNQGIRSEGATHQQQSSGSSFDFYCGRKGTGFGIGIESTNTNQTVTETIPDTFIAKDLNIQVGDGATIDLLAHVKAENFTTNADEVRIRGGSSTAEQTVSRAGIGAWVGLASSGSKEKGTSLTNNALQKLMSDLTPTVKIGLGVDNHNEKRREIISSQVQIGTLNMTSGGAVTLRNAHAQIGTVEGARNIEVHGDGNTQETSSSSLGAHVGMSLSGLGGGVTMETGSAQESSGARSNASLQVGEAEGPVSETFAAAESNRTKFGIDLGMGIGTMSVGARMAKDDWDVQAGSAWGEKGFSANGGLKHKDKKLDIGYGFNPEGRSWKLAGQVGEYGVGIINQPKKQKRPKRTAVTLQKGSLRIEGGRDVEGKYYVKPKTSDSDLDFDFCLDELF